MRRTMPRSWCTRLVLSSMVMRVADLEETSLGVWESELKSGVYDLKIFNLGAGYEDVSSMVSTLRAESSPKDN